MDRRRGTAVLLLTGVVIALTGAVAPARVCPGVTVAGSWKRIETPLRATAFTVDGDGRIFAAGQDAITVSVDGGCTWREVVSVSTVVPQPYGGSVTSMATVGRYVVAAATGPSVIVSPDGGGTWMASSGLDFPGEPAGLYPAPTGDVVYLLVRQEVGDQTLPAAGLPEQGTSVVATVVYRSADGGLTWTRGAAIGTTSTGPHGTGLESATRPGAVWDLAVDPADAGHLLAASRGGVFSSPDGGDTWAPALSEPGSELRAVEMWREAGGTTVALAVDPLSGTLFETADAGGEWRRRAFPQLESEMASQFPNGAAWAWAAADASGDVVLSGPKGIFRAAGASLVDVTPPGLAAPGGIAADLGLYGPAPWARLLDGSALVTEVTPSTRGEGGRGSSSSSSGSTGGLSPDDTAGVFSRPRVVTGRAELTAGARRVELAPGETATVPFEARLAPRPARVDLYFVVDTTSSMSRTIRSLVDGMEDIVVRLARSGIRLRAGIGAFRTYPRESERLRVDYPYRRLRALGPVDAELLNALYELEGAGSSGANLPALYQAVTGEGQDVLPPGPSKADIAPGLDAGFDDRATKVVMHFADTWFGTPERGDPTGHYTPATWPGPTMAATAAALRDEGVMHLGVALQPGAGGNVFAEDADVVEDLRALSSATASLAGDRGADCDGDGRSDLSPGDPLVCLLDRDADAGPVASVVTGLVEALERRGDVALAEAGESGLVRAITPPSHRDVDLRASNVLGFDVTVGCALGDAGTRRAVDLELLVAGRAVAGASLDVRCEPLAPAVRVPDVGPPRVALLPPIPAPPPHPVPGPGPGSVTAPAPVQAPAPAQAPGGQPSAALVAQRQQQPQVAFVAAAQQVRAQTQMQHALVRTRGRDPLATARLWTAVGALSVVWAWGLARATVASVRGARVRP